MPLKLKRWPEKSAYWYIRGTIQGIRVFESTGEVERKKAEAYRLTREQELFERSMFGVAKTLTFAEAALNYMERSGQNRFLTRIIEQVGMKPLAAIDQATVDKTARVLYPGKSPATHVRQVYTPIIAVLNDAGHLVRIKKPKVRRKPVEPATDDYLDKLLPHCNPRLQTYILFTTFSGVRRLEACRLEAKDVDLEEGWAVIGLTKNGDPRMVPLPAQVIEAMKAVMPEEGVVFGYTSPRSVNRALERAAKRAKLPYMSSHKIGRHAFAARLLAKGCNLKTVKEAGGWKSIQVVDQNYGHLEQSQVHQVMLDVAKKSVK